MNVQVIHGLTGPGTGVGDQLVSLQNHGLFRQPVREGKHPPQNIGSPLQVPALNLQVLLRNDQQVNGGRWMDILKNGEDLVLMHKLRRNLLTDNFAKDAIQLFFHCFLALFKHTSPLFYQLAFPPAPLRLFHPNGSTLPPHPLPNSSWKRELAPESQSNQ